jgi:hypothetical protein
VFLWAFFFQIFLYLLLPYIAKAHPGGVAVLQKFHNRNATKAFYAAHHSDHAIAMLQQFAIVDPNNNNSNKPTQSKQYNKNKNNNNVVHETSRSSYFGIENNNNPNMHVITNSLNTLLVQNASLSSSSTTSNPSKINRWKQKLLTKEDPWNIHKCLGIFVLVHFMIRYYRMIFTNDPTGGFGSYRSNSSISSNTITPNWIPILCLLPHGLLSVSSLLFHTVPRDRVIGQPMIWQEYRIHNIGFGIRSVISTLLCTLSIRYRNHPQHKLIRHIAVIGSCLSCFMALIGADIATHYLRSNDAESTTATTPYWDGCTINTQKRFKLFYAYCQFMATLACLLVTNPAFPFCVLFAIQVASLLMTLVRKGLLSTQGYHMGYTATLIAPYFVSLRSVIYMKSPELLFVFVLGSILFHIRRQGINKYIIWVPVIVSRIMYGDKYLTYNIW